MSEHTATAGMPDPDEDPQKPPPESSPLLPDWIEPPQPPTPPRPTALSEPWPDIPGYKLMREVGRGGYGRVFEAFHHLTGQTRALKVLRRGVLATDDDRRRFRQEIQTHADHKHPHIAEVMHADTCADGDYLVMQFIRGDTLLRFAAREHDKLAAKDGGSLATTPPQVPFREFARTMLTILSDITDAVAFVHQRGFLHRDLKPENVLVDGRGHAYLMDFGLAKPISAPVHGSSAQTMWGEVLGTRAYMSPEQVSEQKLDARSDIYSLGVIFYRVLLNAFPYSVDGSFATVADNIRLTVPIPPGKIEPTMPDDLTRIILKCLHKEPQHRYENAGQLAADLRRHLKGEDVPARVMPHVAEISDRRRKRRILAVTALCGLLAGTAAYYRSLLIKQRFDYLHTRGMELRFDQPDEAARAWTEALELNPDAVEPAVQRVLLEARQEQLDNAILHGEELVRRFPQDEALTAVRHSLFRCYRIRGHDGDSAAAGKHTQWLVANVKPGGLDDWLSRATTAPLTSPESIDYLTRVLQLQPKHFEARFERAQRYVKQHNFSAALADAQRLSEDYPHTSRAINLLGAVLLELPDRTPEQTVEMVRVTQRAAALDAQFLPARCNYALALLHTHQYEQAVEQASLVVKADLSPLIMRTAYQILVASLAAVNRNDEALERSRQAAEWARTRFPPSTIAVHELLSDEAAEAALAQLDREEKETRHKLQNAEKRDLQPLNDRLADIAGDRIRQLTRLRRFDEARAVLAGLSDDVSQINASVARIKLEWAAGQYDEALSLLPPLLNDMKAAVATGELDRNEVANAALWVWILSQLRNVAGDAESAAAALALAREYFTSPGTGLLLLWCSNDVTDDLATAPVGEDSGDEMNARLYIALRLLAQADRPAAMKTLRRCLESGGADYMEYDLAYATLRRLETEQPARPGSVADADTAP